MSSSTIIPIEKVSVEQDWDDMRDILIEVENLCLSSQDSLHYTLSQDGFRKTHQAFILHNKGFMYGASIFSCKGDSLLAYGLTDEGREVLGSMRNKSVWMGIKKIAQEKRVELTACTIRNLSTFALKTVFMAPDRLS